MQRTCLFIGQYGISSLLFFAGGGGGITIYMNLDFALWLMLPT